MDLKDTFQIIDMYKFSVPDLTNFEVCSKSHFPMCHFLSSKYFLVNWSFEQFLIFKHVTFFRKFLKELNSIGTWIINFGVLDLLLNAYSIESQGKLMFQANDFVQFKQKGSRSNGVNISKSYEVNIF